MESKLSNKRKLQKKTSENDDLEYRRISSISEGEEKYPENGEEDSATFRDYYDDYINSRNTSQSTNRDAYSSCDDHSDSGSEIVKESQKINGTETSKIRKSRRSSKSRSPRRSLSRKGSKRSSSRRNKKSREIPRDKSPNKHGSQRRKPETISNKITRKSTGSNRFRSLVKTRVWTPKTHDENPKANGELDTSSESESETWKDTDNELSTSSRSKHESCVAEAGPNVEPKLMFSNENTQKQNCKEAEKRNKRSDKKVKSSSIKSTSNMRLQSSDEFCEEDSNGRKNRPETHDEIHKIDSEDEKGSASSLHSSHTYTLILDENSVSNLPMAAEKCEEVKPSQRKKESNRRKHERKRKTKDEATMTEEILFSVGPHLATNENLPGNNSNRYSSQCDRYSQPDDHDTEIQSYDLDNEAQLDHHENVAQPDHHDNEALPDHHENDAQPDHHENVAQPDHHDNEALPDHHDNEALPDNNDNEALPDDHNSEVLPDDHNNEVLPDDHNNEALLGHHSNETQSVSSVGSGHLERLCAKYGVDSDSNDSSSDDSEDEKDHRIKTHVEGNEDNTYNQRSANKKAEESPAEDSTDVVNVKGQVENDCNNNERLQRKRSVHFSEVVPVTEPGTGETTEELVNDDVDKLAAELTVGFLVLNRFNHGSPCYWHVMPTLALFRTC